MDDNRRRAMYDGFNSVTLGHSKEWVRVAKQFVDLAFSGGPRVVKCPCTKCRNFKYVRKIEELEHHLCKNGFMPNYLVWRSHGEVEQNITELERIDDEEEDRMDDLVADISREYPTLASEQATPEEVQEFYKLLHASEEKVHDDTTVTVLQVVTRLMAMKAKYNFSNNCYNDIINLIIDLIPSNHKMPKDLYQSKKIVSGLGMKYKKIDVCEDNCMLFWKEYEAATHCQICGKSRYAEVLKEDGATFATKVAVKQLRYMPITPRLKRLFLTPETAKLMLWHKEGEREIQDPDIMMHPSDGDAWKALDRFDPEFARDARSVRLGLSTDGFTPYDNSSTSYSCWPVFIMPYNPPPNKCMKEGFIFLALIIPGPKHPGKKINVFMQPLIEEFKELWVGVKAYDGHLKREFTLRAVYLWSIHDLPAYGIWSGWCVHGRLCCPICMGDTQAYRLEHGKKVSFFDCHRRFLPSNHPF